MTSVEDCKNFGDLQGYYSRKSEEVSATTALLAKCTNFSYFYTVGSFWVGRVFNFPWTLVRFFWDGYMIRSWLRSLRTDIFHWLLSNDWLMKLSVILRFGHKLYIWRRQVSSEWYLHRPRQNTETFDRHERWKGKIGSHFRMQQGQFTLACTIFSNTTNSTQWFSQYPLDIPQLFEISFAVTF